MPKLSTPFSHIRSPFKPKEEITNPFMTDLSHQDNNQVLMKEAPQLKEWPTFTGEGEYDHMSFIKTIEMLQEDYAIPDELITARLQSLFEKSAKRWYYGIRKTNGKNTWSWWKQEIITKWANDAWRYKIENSFENSFFDPDKDKPLPWLLKQVERLNALYPEMSQKMVQMKIMKKCGGELENALRSRFIEPCSKEEYINALKDIVTRTKIGRTWKKLDIKSPNKPFIKKDKPKEAFKPNKFNSNEQRKCHKCGENHNDKEEESDSEKETEESKTSESDEVNIANAEIRYIGLIYEVLDVNSNLPQVGTSDTSPTNIQDARLYRTKPAKGMGYTDGNSIISTVMVETQEAKVNLDTGEYCSCVLPDVNSNLPQVGTSDTNLTNVQDAKLYTTKPAKRMGYTAGKSSISIIMVDNKEAKVNLDTGAYCTCVGQRYLKTIVPDWEEKLIPKQGVKFSSASESMKPLGIIDLTLIFPHPSQCVRTKIEFVVMENCTSNNLILEMNTCQSMV
ncbi:hypothetical protein O181_081878 [Austropuccinia psidii MF-1]|uniref:Retrotransposon gag domain-containing protein n=1 Tax=Austropuccinia psidii MF-1 TaxID=1389203 RepID=A0A9Q3FLF5_9BASI|nr:hypothetical protein [Austropuccinia psidii MF-1]